MPEGPNPEDRHLRRWPPTGLPAAAANEWMDQETARTLLQEAVEPASCKAVRRRRRPLLWSAVVLVFLSGLGTGLAYLRLSQGPLRIDGLTQRVAEAIAGSVGPGWRVTLNDSALELDPESSLALRVGGLDVYNPEGALVVRAPLAVVSLDMWGLLRLSVQPRSIEFRDLQMTALVHDDGSIAFAASAPSQADAAKPHTLPSVDAARGQISPVSAAVASIFGVVLDPAGVIGALDRARITNGRLTLVDDDARHRATFEQVNGLFHRAAATARGSSNCASTGRTASGASAARSTMSVRADASASSPSTTCRSAICCCCRASRRCRSRPI